ncbi:MAG: GNAT family N-acetyltransferase [Flavobacteriales bacterium]|nr:GNAT family N-acetyltransferase [Flavobacteriales bacterium]
MLTIDLPIFPILTTERLVLRELRPSDVERVFAMRSDPLVMEHVPRPMATKVEDASALIDLINSMVAAKDAVQWAITLKGDDTFVGLIGFWRIVKEHHFAELGYMLARDHWGKGYISEAIGTVLPFGFEALGFHRVEAITRPENVASIRALEKNGFVREAHFKENIFWNGAFHDSLHFGRLETDSRSNHLCSTTQDHGESRTQDQGERGQRGGLHQQAARRCGR